MNNYYIFTYKPSFPLDLTDEEIFLYLSLVWSVDIKMSFDKWIIIIIFIYKIFNI